MLPFVVLNVENCNIVEILTIIALSSKQNQEIVEGVHGVSMAGLWRLSFCLNLFPSQIRHFLQIQHPKVIKISIAAPTRPINGHPPKDVHLSVNDGSRMRIPRMWKWPIDFYLFDPHHMLQIKHINVIVGFLKFEIGRTVIATEKNQQHFVKNTALFFAF